MLDHEYFQFFITCKRINNAINDIHYVKLGKKGRESSKRNYYIISPRVITKAIIIKKQNSQSKHHPATQQIYIHMYFAHIHSMCVS